jgi:large subunit ribosomal protein L15
MVEKKKTPTRKAPARPASPRPKAPAAAAKPKAPRAPAKKRVAKRAAPPSPPPATEAPAVASPAIQASAPARGIHDLRPASGATRDRKRVGRGPGSGHGKTAGRGSKGQKSRTGYRHMRGFEGGQMPLHRRVPKRGFTNIFRIEYDIVNLSDLAAFEEGQAVTPDSLAARRLVRKSRPIKILGDGELARPLNVSAHKFSASARARIEAAGGSCEVLPR